MDLQIICIYNIELFIKVRNITRGSRMDESNKTSNKRNRILKYVLMV